MSSNNRRQNFGFARLLEALLDSSPDRRRGQGSNFDALLKISGRVDTQTAQTSIFAPSLGDQSHAPSSGRGFQQLAGLLSSTTPTRLAHLPSRYPQLLSIAHANHSNAKSTVRTFSSLKSDLQSDVAEIFRSRWDERDGEVVPDEDSMGLGKEAVKLDATVLYADLGDSTSLVDTYAPFFAAEIYKAFLHCAAKIIRSEDGEITAYDGDRIMAVYVGDMKNTQAVRSAMKINHAVERVIDPALRARYPETTYSMKYAIGIDTSSLFVARTGVRGANDLVWVGRAANYAAKLSTLPASRSIYLTKEVYDRMNSGVKLSSGTLMWEPVRWNTFDDRIIYRSTWMYSFS